MNLSLMSLRRISAPSSSSPIELSGVTSPKTSLLVAQAASKIMNPTLPDEYIAAKYAEDVINARAELGTEFRNDIRLYISPEVVDACVVPGCHECMPERGIEYHGFIDV